ncbi:MAG: FAD-dependent oxidoreductase [Oscillospiraceae bacterium]
MSKMFPHLLSPIRIGNHVLKSRIIAPQSLPHYIQGSEPAPSPSTIQHVANIAKNGAAIVGFSTWDDTLQRTHGGAAGHFPMYDYSNPANETYVCKLVDTIHFYDSLASIHITPMEMPNFQPQPSKEKPFPFWFSTVSKVSEITYEMMRDMIELAVQKTRYFQSLGFDMCSLQMSYREYLHIGMSKFFSPLTNDRTDEYGGDVAGRGKLALDMCRAIKEACGPDFLIDLWIAGEEEDEGGITVEDTVRFAKLAEGVVDILHIRGGNINFCHPTGFNSIEDEPYTLHIAEAVKKSGANIIVAAAGGYADPVKNEEYIASGKLDMVAVARQFICDSDYGKKIMEDRPEDIVPCQRCAKCHVPFPNGPWTFVCSGNPKMGLMDQLGWMVEPPARKKKVAVIGGGVAGMEAALVAAERGHRVVLFEKSSVLGGQLIHADFAAFKWPLRNFKNYLIRHVNKSGVEVRLSCPATPEDIKSERFDVVIAACGAAPNRLKLPGAWEDYVWLPIQVFGHEAELGKKVVVVGGGEIGTETALYLAECGHDVTVLTRQTRLAPNATGIHYREMFEERWQKNPNFHFITEVRATDLSNGQVRYIDKENRQKAIPADSVVLAAGRCGLTEEALSFAGAADEFYIIGDCKKPGSVQTCMRMAYAAASRI